jgi:pilus retraction protein PilT
VRCGVNVYHNGMQFRSLLQKVTADGASDVHLRVGLPPFVRKDGVLSASGEEPVGTGQIAALLAALGRPAETGVLDGTYALSETCRVRVHAFQVQGQWSAVLRVVPARIPTLAELRLPETYAELCALPQGLVLIGGAARSGRSTTLAAMLQTINRNRAAHLIVVEEPIEHLYRDELASVTQIEVRSDAPSWEAALDAAIRSDADVIALGELRGERLVLRALEAAEMGLLVVAVAAGMDASVVLRELHGQVGAERQGALALGLATHLRAVVCQRLVPSVGGTLRPLCQVLLSSGAVRDCLARGQYEQLSALLTEDDGRDAALSYDRHLLALLEAGEIEPQTAAGLAEDRRLIEQRYGYQEGL